MKAVIESVLNAQTDNEIREIFWMYSGDANRFTRQQIALALTGERIPIVKCGVSHLAEYAKQYRANHLASVQEEQPAIDDNPIIDEEPVQEASPKIVPDGAALVGTQVTRKCGTIATVIGWDDLAKKLTVQLPDGTKTFGMSTFRNYYTIN